MKHSLEKTNNQTDIKSSLSYNQNDKFETSSQQYMKEQCQSNGTVDKNIMHLAIMIFTNSDISIVYNIILSHTDEK